MKRRAVTDVIGKRLKRYVSLLTVVLMLAGMLPALAYADAAEDMQWNVRSPIPNLTTPKRVAYGQNLYVGVSFAGVILTSSDGKVWTKRTSSVSSSLNDIIYDNTNGKFVAVGDTGMVATSDNGIQWSSQKVTTANLNGVIYANQTYVTVGGNGAVLTSSDAITWSTQTAMGSQTLYSVAYGKGLFVVAGDKIIRSSPDGKAWTNRLSGGSSFFYRVAFVNDGFWVMGSTAGLRYSSDGVNGWTVKYIADAVSPTYRDMIYTGGKYMVVTDSAIYSRDRKSVV